MFKPMLVILALASTTACMTVEGPEVTRGYSGSLNGCPGLSGISAQYSQSVAGLPVRCGPQSASPITLR